LLDASALFVGGALVSGQETEQVGRKVIVTGASGGIGAEIAAHFCRVGDEVLLVDKNVEGLRDKVERLQAAGCQAWDHQADVSSLQEVRAMVDAAASRWGHIDVLVNCVGVIEAATPFLELQESEWDHVLGTNLKGYLLVSQGVARVMAMSNGGAIVHVASIDWLGYDGPHTAYQCSKAAVVALCRAMAVELAPYSIRVNTVSPGYVRTEMAERVLPPEQLAYLAERFERAPLKRTVDTHEIALACAFLASDQASGITGQDLVVDGGLTANLYILETLP